MPEGTISGESVTPVVSSIERYMPILAVGAMIATFAAVPPSFAMTMVAVIWLVGTRLNPSRRLLGLTLTEGLAWAATVAIVEFLAVIVLYLAGGVTRAV